MTTPLPLPPAPPVVESILDLVGETPLVRLSRVVPEGCATIWGKAEQLNPGASVKDRIGAAMLEAAEREGRLAPGGTVIEPTSGNTGLAIAMACAVKGYRCILTMPESMSLERRELLKSYGAKLVLTPAEEQMAGAVAKAEELVQKTPGAFMPRQFDNAANPAVHERTTGPEILRAMGDDRVAAFVAGIGTAGTIVGVGRFLKRAATERGEAAPLVVGVEPEGSRTIATGERGPSKIQGIAAGFVPANYDASVVDRLVAVHDTEAWAMRDRLAKEEGLLVGISAGANVAAAVKLGLELGPAAHVVTILCDTGERYFSLAAHFAEREPA
jgi:cysteine synthase A